MATFTAESYARHKAAVALRQNARTAQAQEIGEIPAIANKERRESSRTSFPLFCREYFPSAYTLPWAPFHFQAAALIEDAVRNGGLYVFAMPRGSGKTTICEWAMLWSTLHGLSRYVVLVGATEGKAEQRLRNIKVELQTNELLLADFPEVVYPIRKLERSVRRAEGQKYNGESTGIKWNAKFIVYPTIPNSAASGSIVQIAGITGGDVRGINHKTDSGEILRPDFAICDDPQTRESSKSFEQTKDREAIVSGDIAYMAGPGKPIAVVMPCTVIYRDDLADRMLDRERYPEWRGTRTKMVESFPTNQKLWEEYWEIRTDSLKSGGDGAAATEFYRANRVAMDEGAVVTWPERFNKAIEVSAVEHVMKLKLRDEAAFSAEYQNEPLFDDRGDETPLTARDVIEKVVPYKHREVPEYATHLVAFADVQQSAIYFTVCAFSDTFSGVVIDYGTVPEQPTRDFAVRSLPRTLQQLFPSMGLEGQLYNGLTVAAEYLCGRTYTRCGDGAEMSLGRMMIDANWGQTTDLVYQFCRESDYRAIILPSHGIAVGASGKPFSEYRRQRGDQVGQYWRLPAVRGKRALRHVLFDANFWKSFTHERWRTSPGDAGCLSLYGLSAAGDKVDVRYHDAFASHQVSEYSVATEGRGRRVNEWKQKPSRPDNHWLDCLVGCCVAASMLGAKMIGSEPTAAPAAGELPRITRDTIGAIRQRR